MHDQYTHTELLSLIIENKVREKINTCFPARITSTAQLEAKQVISVEPLIRDKQVDGSLDTLPIHAVPVVYPAGGTTSITWPLAVGDTVLVLISQHSLSQWLYSDGGKVNEWDTDRFNLNDAIAVPSMFTINDNLKPNQENLEVKHQNSSMVITGNDDVLISNPTASAIIQEDGTIVVNNGNGSVSISSSGTIAATNSKCNLSMTSGGAVTLANENSTLSMSSSDTVQLDNGTAQIKMFSGGDVEISNGSSSEITLSSTGAMALNRPNAFVQVSTSDALSLFSTAEVSIDSDTSITLNAPTVDISGAIVDIGASNYVNISDVNSLLVDTLSEGTVDLVEHAHTDSVGGLTSTPKAPI